MTVTTVSPDSDLYDLSHRTKTWGFKDDFAREADQRRRTAAPRSSSVPRNEAGNSGIERARRFAPWSFHLSRPLEDEERARGTFKKQHYEVCLVRFIALSDLA